MATDRKEVLMRTRNGQNGALWGGSSNPLANACAILGLYSEEFENAVSLGESLMFEISPKDAKAVWELYDEIEGLCFKLGWLLDNALSHIQMPYQIISILQVAGTGRFYCRISRRTYTKTNRQKEGS